MDTIPLDLAFARLGAVLPGSRRALCAMAEDGSLVMVCQSSGFSRPLPGVMRYSATLSLLASPRSQVDALRTAIAAAFAAGTTIRLIIQTPAATGAPARIHTRADLAGDISAFDGDAYSVDFTKVEEEEEPEPPANEKRRR